MNTYTFYGIGSNNERELKYKLWNEALICQSNSMLICKYAYIWNITKRSGWWWKWSKTEELSCLTSNTNVNFWFFLLTEPEFWQKCSHHNWIAGILRWFGECCSSAVCVCGIPCPQSEGVRHLCRSDRTDKDLQCKCKNSFVTTSNNLSVTNK